MFTKCLLPFHHAIRHLSSQNCFVFFPLIDMVCLPHCLQVEVSGNSILLLAHIVLTVPMGISRASPISRYDIPSSLSSSILFFLSIINPPTLQVRNSGILSSRNKKRPPWFYPQRSPPYSCGTLYSSFFRAQGTQHAPIPYEWWSPIMVENVHDRSIINTRQFYEI